MTDAPALNGATIRQAAPADPAMDDQLTAFFTAAAKIINATDTASGDVLLLGRQGIALRIALDEQIIAAQEQANDPALALAAADGYGVQADHLRRLYDRITAVLSKLRAAHQLALQREEEARRRAAFNAAAQAAQKAADGLPAIESRFRAALAAAEEARRQVAQVNAALPADTAALVLPVVIQEEIITGEEETTAWCDRRTGAVILDPRPFVPGRSPNVATMQTHEVPLVRRKVRKILFRRIGEQTIREKWEALPQEPEAVEQLLPSQIDAAQQAAAHAQLERAREERRKGAAR